MLHDARLHGPHACMRAVPEDGGPPQSIADDHRAELLTRSMVISGPVPTTVPPYEMVFAIAMPVFVAVDNANDTFGYGPDSARCGRELPCYDPASRTKWWAVEAPWGHAVLL